MFELFDPHGDLRITAGNLPHWYQPGVTYFVTFRTEDSIPQDVADLWYRRRNDWLRRHGVNPALPTWKAAFRQLAERQQIEFHQTFSREYLANLDKGYGECVLRYLARLKQPYSKQIKELLERSGAPLLRRLTVRERPDKICFRYWQEGPGFDRNLRMPKAIIAAIDYFHENPVRRRLCRRAVDWKWSSARWYLGTPPRQQDPDLPLIHGLPWGALDGNEVW